MRMFESARRSVASARPGRREVEPVGRCSRPRRRRPARTAGRPRPTAGRARIARAATDVALADARRRTRPLPHKDLHSIRPPRSNVSISRYMHREVFMQQRFDVPASPVDASSRPADSPAPRPWSPAAAGAARPTLPAASSSARPSRCRCRPTSPTTWRPITRRSGSRSRRSPPSTATAPRSRCSTRARRAGRRQPVIARRGRPAHGDGQHRRRASTAKCGSRSSTACSWCRSTAARRSPRSSRRPAPISSSTSETSSLDPPTSGQLVLDFNLAKFTYDATHGPRDAGRRGAAPCRCVRQVRAPAGRPSTASCAGVDVAGRHARPSTTRASATGSSSRSRPTPSSSTPTTGASVSLAASRVGAHVEIRGIVTPGATTADPVTRRRLGRSHRGALRPVAVQTVGGAGKVSAVSGNLVTVALDQASFLPGANSVVVDIAAAQFTHGQAVATSSPA